MIQKNDCFLHLIHLSWGIRNMRQREKNIPHMSRTSTLLSVLFWSCRLKRDCTKGRHSMWWRQSHAALGNCLSSSLPQNFCVVLGKFLKPTLSEVMTDWVLLVLCMCGWRFRVWREGVLSSHSRSWGNTYWALETESRLLNKLRNQVLGSTKSNGNFWP